MQDSDPPRPVSASRLSKTPSWITLGFVLGVLFVWALPHDESKGRSPRGEKPVVSTVQLERPRLTEIEAVFADWERYAVWQDDVTEVAYWDTEKRSYTIFYEVFRRDGNYYFRSIPRLTRPILKRGVPEQSPLEFTETEESRRAWIEHAQFVPQREPLKPR